MKIEINSGGLQGNAIIEEMKADVNRILTNSLRLDSALSRIKAYAAYTNGTAQNVSEAIGLIEQREREEQKRAENIRDASRQVETFIGNTRAADRAVAQMITTGTTSGKSINSTTTKQSKIKEYSTNVSDDPEIQRQFEEICRQIDEISDFDIIGYMKRKVLEVQKKIIELEGVTPYAYDNIVYPNGNSDGKYGGNQHGPQYDTEKENDFFTNALFGMEDNANVTITDTKKYREIIRKNTGLDLSNEEVREYVKKMAENGCGYTAIVNSIYMYYSDRPNGEREFEERFGFPMKDKDGKMDYDTMMLDLYTKYYNRNDNPKHEGTTWADRNALLKWYIGGQGDSNKGHIDVEIRDCVHVTPQNIDDYLKDGNQVIASFRNINVYKTNGEKYLFIDGGHAVVITGVDSNGNYIVSSWGEKYLIKPEEIEYIVTNPEQENNISKDAPRAEFSIISY